MEGDIPDINKVDTQSKRYVKTLVCEIEEIDSWMEILNEETTYARYKVLYRDKRSTKEAWWHRFRHALLKIQLNSWQEKRDNLFEKLIAKLEELKQTENVNGSTDGQEPTPINSEPTIKIEVQIDDEKSDEQSHQFIESVETENYIDDFSQAEQQQKPQHSTVEDSPIKTKVIYAKKRSTSDQAVRVQRHRRSDYRDVCRHQVPHDYPGSRADIHRQRHECRHIQRRYRNQCIQFQHNRSSNERQQDDEDNYVRRADSETISE